MATFDGWAPLKHFGNCCFGADATPLHQLYYASSFFARKPIFDGLCRQIAHGLLIGM
jgi:hypothetical protein